MEAMRSLICKRNRLDDAGRKSAPSYELTAFDEQRQLTGGQLDGTRIVAKQRREATALEALLKHAQACAIPHQDFAAAPTTIAEQEQITAQRVALQALFHEPIEPVVALAEIDGLGVREHAYGAAGAQNHPSSRSSPGG